MSSYLKESNRKLLPIWLPAGFINGSETNSIKLTKDVEKTNSLEYIYHLASHRFALNPNIENAIEVLEAAFISGKSESEINQVRNRLIMTAHLNSELKKVIESFHIEQNWLGVVNKESHLNEYNVNSYIKDLKKKLLNEPRLALTWSDRAFAYTVLGQLKKAEYAIKIALHLSPTNRTIIRNAVRFYIHIDKPEQAHWLLTRHPNLRNDPWLLSSEISCAELINKKSKYLKNSFAELNRNRWLPEEITELSSTIGNHELERGNLKNSKRLIAKSLLCPNYNSTAQAQWLVYENKLRNLNITNNNEFNEASVYRYARAGNFNLALEHSEKWRALEPYSIRPILKSLWLSFTVLGNNTLASQILRTGLRLHPENVSLLNLQSIYLAITGNVPEAWEVLKKTRVPDLDKSTRAVLNATKGLVYSRSGYYEMADRLYKQTENYFKVNNQKNSLAIAQAFHGREAQFSGRANEARALFSASEKNSSEHTKQELEEFITRSKAIVSTDIKKYTTLDYLKHNIALPFHEFL